MTTVFAITQFVLLTLGAIFLKGMVNANGDITSSPYFQFIDRNWIWFFLLPDRLGYLCANLLSD